MPKAPSPRTRAIGTPLLILYILVVLLAGWPTQVRPALLDAAHAQSLRTLRWLGISAGWPLFHTTENPWKVRGHCLFIRADANRSGGGILFPPDGECQLDGFHPRLPPMDRATHRMLSSAWENAQQGRVRSTRSDSYAHAIGRHFCLASDPAPHRIEAVWIWYYLRYDSGDVTRVNGLQFEFDCSESHLGELTWHPADESVVAFWGSAPWP